ncbi:MAG: hypothetical protein R3321_05560 [Nitrososphaeraceae archaeon]|nr:hypothetical protein [Nitrososphaeraceae archaeon]
MSNLITEMELNSKIIELLKDERRFEPNDFGIYLTSFTNQLCEVLEIYRLMGNDIDIDSYWSVLYTKKNWIENPFLINSDNTPRKNISRGIYDALNFILKQKH